MSGPRAQGPDASAQGGSATPAWAVIAGQELRNLWMGGRALLILVGLSAFLSIFTYLLSTSEDLTRMTQTDLIGIILQVTVSVGILLVLVLSADSFSGERDRGTLENLLLTPVPRHHMAFGKFVGALSIWAGVLVVSIPYLALPANGTGLLGHAVALGAVVGTVLVVGFYFLGALVSALSRSNVMSFTLSLFAFFAMLSPLQLPGSVKNGRVGTLLINFDPASAGITYMAETLASGGSWAQEAAMVVAPMVFLVAVVLVGLWVFDRHLDLTGGGSP
jgi:ABC-2 type transport system permease protein